MIIAIYYGYSLYYFSIDASFVVAIIVIMIAIVVYFSSLCSYYWNDPELCSRLAACGRLSFVDSCLSNLGPRFASGEGF